MPKYEYKNAHRREVVLRSGLQKDVVAKPGLQARSQKESFSDKYRDPCNSDSFQREWPNPKHQSVPQRASGLSSGVGQKLPVTTNADESPQKFKLKMSVEGLSDGEVLLVSEADCPDHRLEPDVQDSDMPSFTLLDRTQMQRDQSGHLHSNSRFSLSTQAQGHSLTRSANESWDAVGTALKNNDSTFNMKNMSRTGLWPAKPTLRTRPIPDILLSQHPVNISCPQSQSLSAEKSKTPVHEKIPKTSRKVIFTVHDGT